MFDEVGENMAEVAECGMAARAYLVLRDAAISQGSTAGYHVAADVELTTDELTVVDA
jgi:hypothetical protein